MWRDAAGSWADSRDSKQYPATHYVVGQAAHTLADDPSSVMQPLCTQPPGQGAVPLHVVLPDGSVGVLAASFGDVGQQGSWQPVLMVPAAPVTAFAGPASQQDMPEAQTRAAAIAAPYYLRKLQPGSDAAPRSTSAKRRHCRLDAPGDSNQAAAQSLRERLAKRNKPADGPTVLSNGEDQTEACISLQQPTADASLKSTSRLMADGADEPRRQPGGADALATLPLTIADHRKPSAPAGAEPELGGGRSDATLPECLRRMAKAGDDSEVVFLGTGCAEPSKYRGASGILLRCGLCDGTALHVREACGLLAQRRAYDPARRVASTANMIAESLR